MGKVAVAPARWRWVGLLAVLGAGISASGCETPGQGANSQLGPGLARLASGVSGYQGEVRPLTTPISLEFGEVTDARMTIKTTERRQDGTTAKESASEVSGRWTARQTPLNTILDLRIVEYKDARGTRTARQPLLQMIVLASRAGASRDISISFPGVREAGGAEPTKDSEVYKTFVKALESSLIPFAPMIRQVGDPVYAKDMVDMIGLMIGSPISEADRRAITTSGGISAVGLTTVNGRLSLLARLDGTVAMRDGARTIEFRVEGYNAIDLVTGLVNEGLGRVRVEDKTNGIPTRVLDTLTDTKTSY